MEGISSDTLEESYKPRKRSSRSSQKTIQENNDLRNTPADTDILRSASSHVDSLNGENFKHMTSDDVMASIFADTAKTTLQEQARGESRKRGPVGRMDRAARTVSESNLEDLFEGAGKWANLAFASKVTK